MSEGTCVVADCDTPALWRGLCQLHYYRDWRDRNREKRRADWAAWKRANPEKVRASERRRAAKVNARQRERYASDPAFRERYRESNKRWAQANPEKTAAKTQRRIARRNGAEGSLSGAEWLAILAAANGRCFYCGKECDRMEQEHMTPLSRGGRHDASNVVAACKPCNLSKHTMTADEFMERRARKSP